MSWLFNNLQKKMQLIAVFCLLGMTTITGLDIIGRYFNIPIFGSEEMVSLIAVLSIAFILPLAHTQRSHIRVEILFRILPKTWQRLLKALSGILSIILFSAISWRLILYGIAKHKSGVVTMNLEFPETGIILVLAAAFIIVTGMMLLDLIKILVKGEN